MRALLIVYDNGSHIPFFPQGMAYIAGALDKAGHEVYMWMQDVSHNPESELTKQIELIRPDVVGLGFNAGYYQWARCLKIAQAVNRAASRSKFRFVLGGHGPAAAPDYFLNKYEADEVCQIDGEVYFTGEIDDIDDYPWPAYEILPMQIYRMIRWPTAKETDFCFPVLSTRGCPYKCTFCYRMKEGDFRPRSPEAVIEEMEFLHTNYGINHFQFSDELFMSSRQRITTFCEALTRVDIPNFKWDCNGRLNFAKADVLQLMKMTGCEYINYGIEALDDQVLKNIRKGLTVRQIENGVKNTLAAGITPGLNFMWGNSGDTKETLQKAVDFLIKYDTCAELRTIRPMTPYPGSQAFKDSGLTVEEFYEEKHTNSDLLTVNLTDLSDKDFHARLFAANDKLHENYQKINRHKIMFDALDMYSGKNPNFRGFRPI